MWLRLVCMSTATTTATIITMPTIRTRLTLPDQTNVFERKITLLKRVFYSPETDKKRNVYYLYVIAATVYFL